jgi:hypothetical protein
VDRPVLRVTDLRPFTVHGTRFEPRENLRIVVTTKRSYVRRLEAGSKGTFKLQIRHIAIEPCGQYAVRAYGPSGLRTAVKTPPQVCGAEPGPQ